MIQLLNLASCRFSYNSFLPTFPHGPFYFLKICFPGCSPTLTFLHPHFSHTQVLQLFSYPGGMEHNVGMAGMMTEQTGQTTSWLSRSPLNSGGFDWNLFLAQILFLLYSYPLMCRCCFLIVCH